MKGPEAKIEARLRDKVHRLGGLCWKWVAPGKSGVPDRIVIYRGRTYYVELKAPTGRLSPMQKVRHAELEAAGVSVHVLWGNDDVDKFVADLEHDSN